MNALRALRRDLHGLAECSNDEAKTSEFLRSWLRDRGVEIVAENLGGHGFLARVGEPRVLLRADLDALPDGDGARHGCGHDGHMAMLAGALVRVKQEGGGAYGWFQPAEETGEGAARCLEDPRLRDLNVQGAYAIHNVPGLPFGSLLVRDGPAAVASRGLAIKAVGRPSHAAEPHEGHSPVSFLANLALLSTSIPNQCLPLGAAALVTVVGLQVGGPHFGSNPGEGSLFLTLRAESDAHISTMEEALRGAASEGGLDVSISVVDPFPATVNDAAFVRERLDVTEAPLMPWSEDFGHATNHFGGALLLLGAGETVPLHGPDYEFPDDLLEVGVDTWWRLAQ